MHLSNVSPHACITGLSLNRLEFLAFFLITVKIHFMCFRSLYIHHRDFVLICDTYLSCFSSFPIYPLEKDAPCACMYGFFIQYENFSNGFNYLHGWIGLICMKLFVLNLFRFLSGSIIIVCYDNLKINQFSFSVFF